MSKFRVVIGDWSGDGHNETKTYVVVVDDKFTMEILGANYKKNVEELGINPTTFVDEYEDGTVPASVADKLQALGVQYTTEEYGDGENIFTTQGMLDIMMFMFGYGLVDFNWGQEPEITYPILAGGYGSAIGTDNIGYGLLGY